LISTKLPRFIWVDLFYVIFSILLTLKDLPTLPELPHRVLDNKTSVNTNMTFTFSCFRWSFMWSDQKSWNHAGLNMSMM